MQFSNIGLFVGKISTGTDIEERLTLGLRQNINQFLILVLVNASVDAMVGLEHYSSYIAFIIAPIPSLQFFFERYLEVSMVSGRSLSCSCLRD